MAMHFPLAIQMLDFAGTAVFALTGALRAVTHKLDLMGAMVLAVATALGGGMMRDALLGSHPPAAFVDESYLMIALTAGVLTFFWGKRLNEQEPWIIAFDALGLGVFTLVGAFVANEAGLGVVGIVFIAMLTATGGGALRAMLVSEIPFILREEVYASASLIGALVYVVLMHFMLPEAWVFWLVIVVTCLIRLLAWRWNIHLPQS